MVKNNNFGFFIKDGLLYQTRDVNDYSDPDKPHKASQEAYVVNIHVADMLCEIKNYGYVFTTSNVPQFRNVTINEGETLWIDGKAVTVKDEKNVQILKHTPKKWWVFSYKQLNTMLVHYRSGNCGITIKGLYRYNDLHLYETPVPGGSIIEGGSPAIICDVVSKILLSGEQLPHWLKGVFEKMMKENPTLLIRHLCVK